MKQFKVLPITLAVMTSFTSGTLFAANSTVEQLEQRIQELEVKADPSDIVFSGYARYGAHLSSGDNRYAEVGSTGRALGRLGNEANGGEVQFKKIFQADNGAQWDLVFMVDDWNNDQWASSGGVNLKKMYAGVTNVFADQPDLYLWAGRDFHQRPQQGLNDYFFMTHDGQGAGFKNLNLEGAMLDMGLVAQVDSDDGALGNDTGQYAITSRLHGINAGIGNLDLYANYGFASDEADDSVQDETAWQVGAVLGLGSADKLVVKYADGADNSAFDLAGDKQVVYVSVEGSHNASDQLVVDYLVSYKDISGSDVDEKNEYSGIVRPQYQWDDVHSTWLEAGYAMEDFDDGSEKSGWKMTLSQNVSLGGMPGSRPMLRFYTTVGDVETKGTTGDSVTADTVAFGAMFEAWW
jgi:maltoporin